MKALSLFAFATVFLLSAALPEGKGKGRHSGLIQPDDPKNESLQRRKPPVKVPGPALMDDDSNRPELRLKHLTNDEEDTRRVYLTNEKSKKHFEGVNTKGKSKHLVNGDHKADNEEGNQEERSRTPRYERNSP